MGTTTRTDVRSDIELIVASRDGDNTAYDELYRRHHDAASRAARALSRSRADADDIVAEAFTRVLRALRSGRGPDVAFRPYLLTTVRNAWLDRTSRQARETPTGTIAETIDSQLADDTNASEHADRVFALQAFSRLPERWQTVLWHLDVEGESVLDLAARMRLAPNAVSALAYRAREGLRQEFINVQVGITSNEACFECRQALGGYVRSRLSARELRRVEQHLDVCSTCSALMPEILEINHLLRAALIPVIVGVAPQKFLETSRWPWFRKQRKSRQSTLVLVAAGLAVIAATISAAVSTTSNSRDTQGGPGTPAAHTGDHASESSVLTNEVGSHNTSASTSTHALADNQPAPTPRPTPNISSDVPSVPETSPDDARPNDGPTADSTTFEPTSTEPDPTVAIPPASTPTEPDLTVSVPAPALPTEPVPAEPAPIGTNPGIATSTPGTPTPVEPTTTIATPEFQVRPRAVGSDGSVVEVVKLDETTHAIRVKAPGGWQLSHTGTWTCSPAGSAEWICETHGVSSTVLIFAIHD